MNPSRKGGGQEEGGGGDVQPSLTCKELNMPLITLVAIPRFSLARSAQIRSLSRSLVHHPALSLLFLFIVKCIKPPFPQGGTQRCVTTMCRHGCGANETDGRFVERNDP